MSIQQIKNIKNKQNFFICITEISRVYIPNGPQIQIPGITMRTPRSIRSNAHSTSFFHDLRIFPKQPILHHHVYLVITALSVTNQKKIATIIIIMFAILNCLRVSNDFFISSYVWLSFYCYFANDFEQHTLRYSIRGSYVRFGQYYKKNASMW